MCKRQQYVLCNVFLIALIYMQSFNAENLKKILGVHHTHTY